MRGIKSILMEKQLFLNAALSRQQLGERVSLPTWHLQRLGTAPALSPLPAARESLAGSTAFCSI